MKKNKGFTLIELLAVIVILAVIALIATPLIMGTIEKSKVNAYKDTVYGILKASENYVSKVLLEDENTYQGETLDLSTETKLNYKGTKPTKGSLKITSSGSMSLAIQNGKYCYMKRANKDEVEVVSNAKECDVKYASNLVKNGYLEYGDNTNFTGVIYQNGVLTNTTGSFETASQEYIPIDTKKTYSFSVDAITTKPNLRTYMGFRSFDIDKREINANHIMYLNNTLTKLTKDLKDGDTKVYFENLSNWNQNIINSTYPYISKGFIFWNYKDSTGYQYPAETYSRNTWNNLFELTNIDKTNNVITLKNPWNHGTIKAGTEVSQSHDGAVYNYCISTSTGYQLKTNWTNSQCQVSKENDNGEQNFSKFRAGTKYIRFSIYQTLNGESDYGKTSLKNIVIEEK